MNRNAAGYNCPNDMQDTKEISRVTWVGVFVNIALTFVKTAFGFAAGSRALLADGVHSLSDLVTDAAILIGVRYWTAPPDKDHPYGHYKIETLITLGIGIALALVGFALGYEAIMSLALVAAGEPAPRTEASGIMLWLALASALTSIISKEILYRWTAARGTAIGSSAVVANAWHHRSDAFSSIPPAISIGAVIIGSRTGYDFWFLDPVATVIVCVMLLKAAWDIAVPSLYTLADRSADRRLYLAIRRTVTLTPGVLSTHKIRTRCIGAGAVTVDLHIQVDGSLSVAEGHEIAAKVKYRILDLKVKKLESSKVVDVMVHVEPA